MERGLVTRGVNVRPHKRTFESAAPHGLRISSAYSLEGCPGRPLPGYRNSDFRTGRKRASVKAPARIRPTVSLEDRVAQVEADWQRAVSDAQACKAQGIPHSAPAERARRLRAQLLNLKGGISHAEVDLAVNAEGSLQNAIKAA